MSDTNRVGLYIARNAEREEPITLSPNELRELRYTGTPGLGFQPNSVISSEIRADRQIPDSILVGASAGGATNFELSFGTFDLLIESAMLSTFTNTQRKDGSTENASFGAGTLTVDDGTDFTIGQLIRLTHSDVDGTEIDDIYEISGIAVNVLTIDPTQGGAAVTAGLTTNTGTAVRVVGWQAQINADISVVVSAGVATFTCPANMLDNAFGTAVPMVAGVWVKLQGFATAANNVAVRVTGVDLGADTFTAVAQTGMATDAATTEQVEAYWGDYIRNGTDLITSHQFAIERRFTDHSTVDVTRELFLGMAVAEMQINLTPQAIATGAFTFLGFNSAVDDTGSPYSALYNVGLPTDIPAEDYEIYNTSTNVGRLALGADDITSGTNNLVLEATLTFNNNLRERTAVGVFGASSIGVGQLNVGGNLNTYFDDRTILDLILGNTDTEYNVLVQNTDGRSLLFDLPRVKLTSGAPDVPGGNQDVVLNPDIQALRDPTLTYTTHIQRWHYIR
jgi:hypothetical protein